MDIDEKKAKISRKLLKFAKIFAKKITHSQKKSFCKKMTVNFVYGEPVGSPGRGVFPR